MSKMGKSMWRQHDNKRPETHVVCWFSWLTSMIWGAGRGPRRGWGCWPAASTPRTGRAWPPAPGCAGCDAASPRSACKNACMNIKDLGQVWKFSKNGESKYWEISVSFSKSKFSNLIRISNLLRRLETVVLRNTYYCYWIESVVYISMWVLGDNWKQDGYKDNIIPIKQDLIE